MSKTISGPCRTLATRRARGVVQCRNIIIRGARNAPGGLLSAAAARIAYRRWWRAVRLWYCRAGGQPGACPIVPPAAFGQPARAVAATLGVVHAPWHGPKPVDLETVPVARCDGGLHVGGVWVVPCGPKPRTYPAPPMLIMTGGWRCPGCGATCPRAFVFCHCGTAYPGPHVGGGPR